MSLLKPHRYGAVSELWRYLLFFSENVLMLPGLSLPTIYIPDIDSLVRYP